MKKEREINWQRERFPLCVGDLEIWQRACVARNQLESPVNDALETQRARVARANDFPRQRFEQMPMLRRERKAAQLASLCFDNNPLASRRRQISAAPLTTIRLCAASSRRDALHVRVNRTVKLRVDPGRIAGGSIVPAIFCAARLVPFQRYFFPSFMPGT